MTRSDGVFRLLDANANRAREAMRVLEDTARFVLDEETLTARCKAIRHEVTTCIGALMGHVESRGRDVQGDVGTADDLDSEHFRPGITSVVMAASHRAGEALRTLEEFAKMFDASIAQRLEQQRYEAYALQSAILDVVNRRLPGLWRVHVLLTESVCQLPWQKVVEAVVAGGADVIQVREKTMTPAALIERVRSVIAIARPAGVSVIVNDHLDVAVAAGADGVHLGKDDVPASEARKVIGTSMVLGGTAHSVEEAKRNHAAGCDYCGVGRMFASRTKPEVSHGGPKLLSACLRSLGDWPLVAIGGIEPANIGEILAVGGSAVAVCDAVCASAHPEEVVAKMRLQLQSADEQACASDRE